MVKNKKERIQTIDVRREMEDSYLAYSMAVIVGRAIPDIYDGLKPVQRRVLTTMKGLGLKSDGPFKKSARVDGDCLGRYHPHGSVYGAMVTMAAPYRNNHRLIDGHGNYGSETDPPAAARYTECRLTPYSEDVLLQDFTICDTRDNYDGSLKEPIRLEASLPNTLIIGNEGIGVGYASAIPQHNLRDVVKATVGLIRGDTPAKLAKYLIPDFPSGCDIVKNEGLKEYLATGRGSIRQRAISTVEKYERSGRKANWDKIVFTNLPYQVSTEKVGEEIKKLLDDGRISDIHHIADETDRTGQRLVVFAKEGRGAFVRDQLYQLTKLDTTFSANNTVVHNMAPRQYAPHEIIWHWIQWRDGRLIIKFESELKAKEGRLHVVLGLLKALSIMDKIITAIRKSADKAEARKKLMGRGFGFSEVQADAILNMRLHALTGMDAEVLQQEEAELNEEILRLKSLLQDKSLRDQYIIDEVESIGLRHGHKRVCSVTGTLPSKVSTAPKPRATPVEKSRYVKIDMKKGLMEQLKGPRGSTLVCNDQDKVVVILGDGIVKKLPSRHKGPLSNQPVEVLMAEKESKLSDQKILAVWSLDNSLYASTLDGTNLSKTTSKGKKWLPDGATLVYLGTKTYTLNYVSKRKKAKQLTVKTIKERPVGSKGNKIAALSEVVL